MKFGLIWEQKQTITDIQHHPVEMWTGVVAPVLKVRWVGTRYLWAWILIKIVSVQIRRLTAQNINVKGFQIVEM